MWANVVVGARGWRRSIGRPAESRPCVPGSALTGDAEVGAVVLAGAAYEDVIQSQLLIIREANFVVEHSVRSSGQRGVTGCGRPFRGFRWVWAIRRLLVTASRRIGRIPLARVVWDARGPVTGWCLPGRALFGDSLPGQRSAVRADYPARRMVKPVQRQD
ncbi:hypothetical protein [Rhodococcus qingshengii]|uniref:hypothetical protein n=1 Tax=Rhodococcus qingshengii TaxID=334542 RepID=UPI001ADFFF18|nr:hypothetical protein [Rhodococcus qingshengii]